MVLKWDVEIDGKKTEMVMESAWSEEVLKNWFIVIKPCLIKNSIVIFFYSLLYNFICFASIVYG